MFLFWAGLAFEEVILLDCFFLIAFFATRAFLLRSVFFARFVAPVLDFARLFLVFLLFDGMVAVYHSGVTGGLGAISRHPTRQSRTDI